ncbi:MAG: radical SAM protein [Desulfobulbaceae bacterium]|jgi:radical SAM superfamily enzyme YgiQ (UPF0313 family)|nr:radical SAM protein [Desulfobulbaceae bacterium]
MPLQNKTKRVLFIFPREQGSQVSNDAVFPFPLLGLTQLASAFPDHYELTLVDESVRPVTGCEDVDLVCITSMTSTARRGYELGDLYRKRGVPVVIGGVHATILPDEAGGHASSIVIGEAEKIIPELLCDFEAGRLKPRYYAGDYTSLTEIKPPRVDLLNWRHRLFIASLQTSRGCPNTCDFCSVPQIFGRTLRLKSLETIKLELQAARKSRAKYMFVVDDNFTANRARARELMAVFKFYGFPWMGFSTLATAEDPAFLQELRDSGCISLFIGFESLLQPDSFVKNKKYADRAAVSRAVKTIHDAGIGIQGSFIFGFDHDRVSVFHEVVQFIQDNEIEVVNMNLLTPFPGTGLYDRFEAEDRLLHHEWPKYDMNHVVFQPKGMSAEELLQGYLWAVKYLASPTIILKRLSWRRPNYTYFLTANFALHRAHTKMANRLWDKDVQHHLELQGGCRFAC